MTSSPCSVQKNRVLLAGFGEHGLRVLQGLIELKEGKLIEWLGAISWSEAKAKQEKGWEKQPDESQFCQLIASSSNVEAVPPTLLNDAMFLDWVYQYQPTMILLSTWGEILSRETLQELSRLNVDVINCHPALLPHHRGANPYTSAIRSGDTQSGVTFHQVTEKLDGGPILLQKAVPIDPADTGGSLKIRCALMAREALAQLLNELDELKEKAEPSHDDSGSYYPPLSITDGAMDWTKSSEVLINQVRGLQPWLDCYMRLNRSLFGWRPFLIVERAQHPTQDVIHPQASHPGHILSSTSKGLIIACGENQAIQFPTYRLHTMAGFLPVSWSMRIGSRLIRAGDMFEAPD